jgi:hypothetical protein
MSLMVNHLKISELRVYQALPVQSVLSGLGSHLQKLKIHLYERPGSLNLAKMEFAHRWVPALPKTLVDLDFSFQECCVMWVRPIKPGEVHWTLASSSWGYAPVYLCDLLPNLKHLRLQPRSKTSLYTVDRVPASSIAVAASSSGYEYDQLLYEPYTDPQFPKLTIRWTSQMVALFVKKLPRNLETLDAGLPKAPSTYHTYLPPSLRYFRGGEAAKEGLPPPSPLPDSLMDSLTHCDYNEGLLDMPRSMESLNAQACFLSNDRLLQLPNTLTSLTLLCSKPSQAEIELDQSPHEYLQVEDYSILPRSLLSLKLIGCIPSKLSSSFDFSHLLPPDLTDLSLRAHYTRARRLEVCHFSSLRAHLKHLRSLEVVLNCAHWVSLDWVPSSVLEELSLGGNGGLRAEAFATFNEYPALLSTLILNGRTGRHLLPSVASKLPKNLTKLCIATTRFGKDWTAIRQFVSLCPPNISLFKLDYYSGEQHMVRLNLPDRMVTLSKAELQRCWSRPFGDSSTYSPVLFIPQSLPMDENHILAPHFFNLVPSITAVDLPVRMDSACPLWQLPALTSLKVRFLPYDRTHDVENTFPNLTSLRASDELAPEWLGGQLFSLLTSLSFPVQKDFSSLSRLSKLTTLTLSFAKLSSEPESTIKAIVKEVFDIIPPSVTALSSSHITGSLSRFIKKHHSNNGRLKSLEITNSLFHKIKDSSLALLAPHLKSLTIGRITLTDPLKAISGLPRDLTEISDLEIAKTICPSLERLNADWIAHSEVEWIYWSSNQALESLQQHTMISLLASMPQTLTRLEWRHGFFNSFGSVLPKTLTTLDLSKFEIPMDFTENGQKLAPLPPSLRSLAINFKVGQAAWSTQITIPQAFLKILPSELKILQSNIEMMPGSEIILLPPGLTTLITPKLVLANQASLLPSSLTSLAIREFNLIGTIPDLPSGLIELHLKCCKLEVWKGIYHKYPRLLSFYCQVRNSQVYLDTPVGLERHKDLVTAQLMKA